jgi:hypothetical protein
MDGDRVTRAQTRRSDDFGKAAARGGRDGRHRSARTGDRCRAASYGITPQTLAYNNGINNGIKDTAELHPGQTVVIPPIDAAIHVVRDGDTLAGISASFAADLDTVRTVNSVAFEPADVVAGRVLSSRCRRAATRAFASW